MRFAGLWLLAVWNREEDRSLVGSSTNLPAILHRHRAPLAMRAHRGQGLQKNDWSTLGDGVFAFEVLDTLPPHDGVEENPEAELRVLEALCWSGSSRTAGVGTTHNRRKAGRFCRRSSNRPWLTNRAGGARRARVL